MQNNIVYSKKEYYLKKKPKTLHEKMRCAIAHRQTILVRGFAQHFFGNEINETDLFGDSLLHTCIEMGYSEGVAVVLTWGADPNIRDSRGRTALEHAREKKQNHAIKHLKQHIENQEARKAA